MTGHKQKSPVETLEDLFDASHPSWRKVRQDHDEKKRKADKHAPESTTGLDYEPMLETIAQYMAVYDGEVADAKAYGKLDAHKKHIYKGKAAAFIEAVAGRDMSPKDLIRLLQEEGLDKIFSAYHTHKKQEDEHALEEANLATVYNPLDSDNHHMLAADLKSRNKTFGKMKDTELAANIKSYLLQKHLKPYHEKTMGEGHERGHGGHGHH